MTDIFVCCYASETPIYLSLTAGSLRCGSHAYPPACELKDDHKQAKIEEGGKVKK